MTTEEANVQTIKTYRALETQTVICKKDEFIASVWFISEIWNNTQHICQWLLLWRPWVITSACSVANERVTWNCAASVCDYKPSRTAQRKPPTPNCIWLLSSVGNSEIVIHVRDKLGCRAVPHLQWRKLDNHGFELEETEVKNIFKKADTSHWPQCCSAVY